MKAKILLMAGGFCALSLALIALPSHSHSSQAPSSLAALVQSGELGPALNGDDNVTVFSNEDGASWLGVESHEVTAEKTKELKLPAERGVVLGKIIPDSPASKAGLKENDVVTEINGQKIEGTTQFRRLIREIPAGRTVQLTVWRDGHLQSVTATLGKAEERHQSWLQSSPGAYVFRTPEAPEMLELPNMDWNAMMAPSARPRLGIDAEDLNGQLGTFFGAPEGEGVLVRNVNTDSPAEKGGMKAGDVIISIEGTRIRSVGELRETLASKQNEKDQSIKVTVLRNKSEVALNIGLPAATPAKAKHLVMHRTNI